VKRFDFLGKHTGEASVFPLAPKEAWCVVVDAETGIAYSLFSRAGVGGPFSRDEVESLVVEP